MSVAHPLTPFPHCSSTMTNKSSKRIILFWIFLIFNVVRARSPDAVYLEARQGETVTLPCNFIHDEGGVPTYVIQWLREEEEMPMIMKIGNRPPQADLALKDRMSISAVLPFSASLQIRNVSSADTATYICKVVFLQSGNKATLQDFNKTVDLKVLVPPSFIRTSRPIQRGRLGAALFLQCKAKGDPHPVVTWMKDGNIITSGKGVEIDEGELNIRHLKRKDSGRYVCRAHSLEGTKQHVINVYVSAPPQIKRVPQDARITEGQDVTFNCIAAGYPPDIKYSWIHKGQLASQSYALRNRHSILRGGETLVVRNVSISDKGQVTCKANNGYGSPPTASANLVVEYTARVSGMPKIVFGGVSRSVKLYCPSLANPPVNRIDWKKNGIDLRVRQNPRYTTDGNGSLIIYAARREDTGRYTCIPHNLIGTEGPGSSILKIRDLPRFVIRPAFQFFIKVGTSFEAPCLGSGNPTPSVSWRKLKNVPTDLMYCVEGGNLTIAAVRKEHHGIWQCVLSSEVGQVTTDVTLVVERLQANLEQLSIIRNPADETVSKSNRGDMANISGSTLCKRESFENGYTSPHKVENVTALAIDQSSIQIKWDPGYDGGFPQHFYVWYKKLQQSDHAWRKMYVSHTRKVAVVKYLKANTAYQISVKSENQRGGGPFSNTVTLKTKEIIVPTTPSPPLPIPTPTALSHATTDDGLIKLTWQPLCCSIDDVLGFLVEYRRLGEASTPGIEPLMTQSETENPRNKRVVTDETVAIGTDRIRRSPEAGSSWILLDKTLKNRTYYELQRHQLYRDQIYEFQVLAVTSTQYSQPSPAVRVSTAGLTVYPLLKEPVTTNAAFQNPVIVGVLSGILLICILITIVVVLYCRHRTLQRSNTKNSFQDSTNDDGEESHHSDTRSGPIGPLIRATTTADLSSSLKRSDYEKVKLFPEGKDLEKNLNSIIKDYEYTEEGRELLYRTPLSSTEFGAKKTMKGGTSDDGSVKKRREIAAKVLWAQKSERHKYVSGLRRTDSLPPRPASATPYHSRNHEPAPHHSRNAVLKDDALCPVSLEDRRRKGTAESHEDPVYLVVQEEQSKRRPISFTFSSQSGYNNEQTNCHNFGASTRNDSFPKSAFSPFYNLARNHNNAMVNSCAGGNEEGPYLSREPHSFLLNDSSFRYPDTTMTSSGHQARPISATLEQASFLRRPQSRASYSFDNRKELRHSFHRNNTDAMMDQTAVEIDCSNSDVMLRLVDDKSRKGNTSGGRKSNRAPCKVGSNTLDEANQINLNPQASPVKVQLRPNLYLRNEHEQRKHASLEALHSPALMTPVFDPQTGQWSQRSSLIGASSKRNSRNNLTTQSSLERRKEQSSVPRPLQNQNFKNQSYPCEEQISFNNTIPVSMEVTTFERPHFYLLHNNGNTRGSYTDDGTMQIAKPTLISLSDIAWSSTRFQGDSGRASSQLSPVSPHGSPSKSSRTHLYQSLHSNSNSFKSFPTKEYSGSLERPFKLKSLSLPSNSQKRLSSLSYKKSRSFGSLRSSTNIYALEGKMTGSVSGIHSLPVSPIKKFPSNSSKSIAKDPSFLHRQHSVGFPKLTLPSSDSKTAVFEEAVSTSHIGSPVLFRRHRMHDESTSSGYVTQEASLTSPGFGNQSASDRTRKDNSSVEDNYEWDSAFAAESEILDALKQFNSLNKTSAMSNTLRAELSKFAMDQEQPQAAYPDRSSPNNIYSTSSHESSEQNKESIEKRCAALREEFLNFQRSQEAADMKRIGNKSSGHNKNATR